MDFTTKTLIKCSDFLCGQQNTFLEVHDLYNIWLPELRESSRQLSFVLAVLPSLKTTRLHKT